ncbi:MAG: lysine 2,3-aminomutase [Gemmatimonadota bacterium]|jgi:KamA family protein
MRPPNQRGGGAGRFRPITARNLEKAPFWHSLDSEIREAISVVSRILPFRSNDYVVEELIDWEQVPEDPIFQLTFPQRGMLHPEVFRRVRGHLRRGEGEALQATVREVRLSLNPHPAGQLTHNVPMLDGKPLPGLQHKYDETVLFFPSQGQTCHAYCSYCFRWAQFVDLPEMQFEARESEDLTAYLRAHPEVSDVLVTGGDPLIMKTKVLARYIEPLLSPDLDHVRNIRIGTKSLAYWPHRFVTDPDSDELLRLLERVVAAGRHMSIMGHYSHPMELSTPVAREAVRRIRSTGAEVRAQAPCIRHVNDDPDVWATLWRDAVSLGIVPYYMFVERDTGARNYFEVPLVRVYEIFRDAYRQVSGLARTVRGPSMSAFPGKVRILGISEIRGEKVFVLDMLQGRKSEWVRRPFFAKFDPRATWLDQLRPAFRERFFFQAEPGALDGFSAA